MDSSAVRGRQIIRHIVYGILIAATAVSLFEPTPGGRFALASRQVENLALPWLCLGLLTLGLWRGQSWARWSALVACGVLASDLAVLLLAAAALHVGTSIHAMDLFYLTGMGVSAAMAVVGAQQLAFSEAVTAFFAWHRDSSAVANV